MTCARIQSRWQIAALLLGLLAGESALAESASGNRRTALLSPRIAGFIEMAWLSAGTTTIPVMAKLDTGAASSSLDATAIRPFDRLGRKWLRFRLICDHGRVLELEAPLVRTARIRRADIGVRERPVVELPVCVGGRSGLAQFTLANRRGLDYRMLIGRDFLAGRLLVDATREHIAMNSCGEQR